MREGREGKTHRHNFDVCPMLSQTNKSPMTCGIEYVIILSRYVFLNILNKEHCELPPPLSSDTNIHRILTTWTLVLKRNIHF